MNTTTFVARPEKTGSDQLQAENMSIFLFRF